MGKLIVTEFVSMDGVMEAPGGEPTHPHTGWTMEYMSPGQMDFKLHETLDAEALLLGRTTYEGFAEAWPGQDDEAGFARKMNSMPKYVVSSTLSDPEWENTTVLHGPVEKSVAELKRQISGTILVAGSGALVHELIRRQLVDELRLMVFPTILGSGLTVFPEGPDRFKFSLARVDQFDNGVLVLSYEPA